MVVVNVNTRDLERSLNRLAVIARKDVPELTRQSARRVAVNLAVATVPFGKDERAKVSVEKAVRKDVSNVYATIPSVMGKLEENARKAYAAKLHNETPMKVDRFLEANNVSLKTRKAIKPGEYNQKRVRGRVKVRNQEYVVAPNAREKFLRSAFRKVGLAKHGWAHCARVLGGVRGLTGWITRKKGKGVPGRVVTQQSAGQIAFTMTNNIPYVSNLIDKKTIQGAIDREGKYLARVVENQFHKQWR
jgi:hypothetical protein